MLHIAQKKFDSRPLEFFSDDDTRHTPYSRLDSCRHDHWTLRGHLATKPTQTSGIRFSAETSSRRTTAHPHARTTSDTWAQNAA
jgi:hypothetical protein